jgi:Fe-S-cluster containining protein
VRRRALRNAQGGVVLMQNDWRKYLTFRCTGCGNCCRGTVVLLTHEDVARIADGTGRAPRDFVRFFGPSAVEMAAADPHWIHFDSGRAVMALKWRNRRCTFLGANNLCQIYTHRPVTCREHPFNVTLSDTGGVEHMSLSRVVKCPHEWDGQSSLTQIRSIARWNQRQADAYVEKVRTWNRRRAAGRTRPAFLRYLGFEVQG